MYKATTPLSGKTPTGAPSEPLPIYKCQTEMASRHYNTKLDFYRGHLTMLPAASMTFVSLIEPAVNFDPQCGQSFK